MCLSLVNSSGGSSSSEWKAETTVAMNAGTNCLWDGLDMSVEVNREKLLDTSIFITVKHKGVLGKDNIVGVGTVSIRRALSRFESLVELSCDLQVVSDGKGKEKKPAGRVVLFVEISKPEVVPVLDPSFVYGTFHITKIRTFDLKNTEIIGLQDPFCILKLGTWTEKTFTKENGGSDVLWDYLDMQTDVFAESLASVPLELEMFDENSGRKNELIGTGSCSLLICGAHIGQEQELRINLLDNAGKASGRVLIYGVIRLPESDDSVEIPEDFHQGILSVKTVSISGLPNSNWFDTVDMFVELKLKKFVGKTKMQPNSGGNACWECLDFKIPVDGKDIRVGSLNADIWDQNSFTKNKKLSNSSISLRRAGGHVGEDVHLQSHLVDVKQKVIGKILIVARLDRLAVLEAKVDLPPSFKSGVIRISKIQAVGLVNKEHFGKQVNFNFIHVI